MARILIADDTDAVRFSLSALLKSNGHEVTEVADGAAAIMAVDSDRFDVVVTDIFMPTTDGLELIRHLRDSYPDLKILAISGGGARFSPKFAKDLASNLGADMTMQKPVDNDAVLANIQALLRTDPR